MVPAVSSGRDRDRAVKQEEDMTRHATMDRDVPKPSAIVNDLLDILRDGELEDEERQMEMEDALEEAASRRHDHNHTHTHTGREPLREMKNLQRPGVSVHEEECDCGHPFCESVRKLLFDQLKKGGDAAARCDPGPELLQEMLKSLYPEATGDAAGTDKDVSGMLKLLLDEVHDGERDEDDEEDHDEGEEEYEDEEEEYGDQARDEEEAVREEDDEDGVREESVMDEEEEDLRDEEEEVEEEVREEEGEEEEHQDEEEHEVTGEEDDQAGEEDEEDEMREEEEEAAGEAVEEQVKANGEEDEDAQIEEDDEEEEEEEKEYDCYNDERGPNWVPPDDKSDGTS